jgi:3-oxoacyl-[acyl-carrier protein] reductase
MISDIDEGAAEKAAGILRDEGMTTASVRCDVTEEAAVEAAVSSCVAELGSIDIMVNNAGITRDATIRKMTVNQSTKSSAHT